MVKGCQQFLRAPLHPGSYGICIFVSLLALRIHLAKHALSVILPVLLSHLFSSFLLLLLQQAQLVPPGIQIRIIAIVPPDQDAGKQYFKTEPSSAFPACLTCDHHIWHLHQQDAEVYAANQQ